MPISSRILLFTFSLTAISFQARADKKVGCLIALIQSDELAKKVADPKNFESFAAAFEELIVRGSLASDIQSENFRYGIDRLFSSNEPVTRDDPWFGLSEMLQHLDDGHRQLLKARLEKRYSQFTARPDAIATRVGEAIHGVSESILEIGGAENEHALIVPSLHDTHILIPTAKGLQSVSLGAHTKILRIIRHSHNKVYIAYENSPTEAVLAIFDLDQSGAFPEILICADEIKHTRISDDTDIFFYKDGKREEALVLNHVTGAQSSQAAPFNLWANSSRKNQYEHPNNNVFIDMDRGTIYFVRNDKLMHKRTPLGAFNKNNLYFYTLNDTVAAFFYSSTGNHLYDQFFVLDQTTGELYYLHDLPTEMMLGEFEETPKQFYSATLQSPSEILVNVGNKITATNAEGDKVEAHSRDLVLWNFRRNSEDDSVRALGIGPVGFDLTRRHDGTWFYPNRDFSTFYFWNSRMPSLGSMEIEASDPGKISIQSSLDTTWGDFIATSKGYFRIDLNKQTLVPLIDGPLISSHTAWLSEKKAALLVREQKHPDRHHLYLYDDSTTQVTLLKTLHFSESHAMPFISSVEKVGPNQSFVQIILPVSDHLPAPGENTFSPPALIGATSLTRARVEFVLIDHQKNIAHHLGHFDFDHMPTDIQSGFLGTRDTFYIFTRDTLKFFHVEGALIKETMPVHELAWSNGIRKVIHQEAENGEDLLIIEFNDGIRTYSFK